MATALSVRPCAIPSKVRNFTSSASIQIEIKQKILNLYQVRLNSIQIKIKQKIYNLVALDYYVAVTKLSCKL